jgi:TonB family protein
VLICGLIFGEKVKFMGCKSWKSSLPFALTFLVGIFAVNFFQKGIFFNKSQDNVTYNAIYSEKGTGYATDKVEPCEEKKFTVICLVCRNGVQCHELSKQTTEKESKSESSPLKIILKPKANYTEDARQNEVQGTASVRVMFLADGEIGNVSVINGLGYGLDDQVILAAKGIKFEPQKSNGQPQTVTKIVQYSFTLF